VKKSPKAQWLGVRQGERYVFKTYAQVFADIKQFASGLKSLDLLQRDVEGKLTLLGIMGCNAPEWTVAEYGATAFAATLVPIYTTTAPPVLAAVLSECGVATVVADFASAKVLAKVKPQVDTLKTVVVYGASSDADLASLATPGLQILSFAHVQAKGKESPVEPVPPRPEDVYTFGYTSGSTGTPKGALITQAAMIAQIACSFTTLDAVTEKTFLRWGCETHVSYLPYAHAMERNFAAPIVAIAGAVCFFQNKRDLLLDDIKTARPTFFPTVPRLLNQIHDGIEANVAKKGGTAASLFQRGLASKLRALHKRGTYKSALWDALVFKNVAKTLGLERCRVMITGSAPISGAVIDFFRVVLSTFVCEGYGSTEMTCAATFTPLMSRNTENVGQPLTAVEIKLVSIPEMNYLVTDTKHGELAIQGRGEICVRGPLLMLGYYRSPEATSKAIDAEGWYHSGDVGAILMDGTIKVFDRVRSIFKLSIGEYVAPEKVEGVCGRASLVAQVYVHGDAFHPRLVAIVVPDTQTLKPWAAKHGLEYDLDKLCANETVVQAVLDEIVALGKSSGLASFEIPKALALMPEQFAVGEILTPTFKLQRAKAYEKYKDKLEELLGPKA